MRKVVAFELVSLDGVIESPEEWALAYSNEEMEEASASGMAAFWPYQPGGTPIADYINSVAKFVVSETLEEPLAWNNSTLIGGNVAQEITGLKRRPGKEITILGSASLVRSLLRDGLLDELSLMVHPVVLGKGKRLFEHGGERETLELVGSQTFGTGIVSLAYRPAREQGS